MNTVGADLHKRTTWFYILDCHGKKINSKNISNNPELLKRYFASIPKPFRIAVEATYNWYFFVDIAQEYAEETFLANSFMLKAFAKAHKKTDKIDARLIATVLYKGFLPVVYIADKETREVRELLRYRQSLIQDRCRNITRLKMILDKIGILSSGDFTTQKKLKEVSQYVLPSRSYRLIIDKFIERIAFHTEKLGEIEKTIATLPVADDDIRNLISICGIAEFSGALIKSEIITIDRFKSFAHLCAYAGLAPRVSQSADKIYHGPINRNRRKYLQWILLELSYHFKNGYPDKAEKFERIKKRKGHNTAKVALARDLLKAIHIVLKEKRPYHHIYEKKTETRKIQLVAADAFVGV